ncbi:VOC family protein [Sphingosinicella sp.]|uniref:VOC family protein n=1 Tax=Sphingosinicella sp. TaxID=1917971 RepID=UPI004037D2DF
MCLISHRYARQIDAGDPQIVSVAQEVAPNDTSAASKIDDARVTRQLIREMRPLPVQRASPVAGNLASIVRLVILTELPPEYRPSFGSSADTRSGLEFHAGSGHWLVHLPHCGSAILPKTGIARSLKKEVALQWWQAALGERHAFFDEGDPSHADRAGIDRGVIPVRALDHIVLCVRDVAATRRFYEALLGMASREERPGKWSLHFGAQKISLQDAVAVPAIARDTVPGSGNFCLLTDVPIEAAAEQLEARGIAIVDGPDQRWGATGPILSIYFHDPDGNLVEISNLVEAG